MSARLGICVCVREVDKEIQKGKKEVKTEKGSRQREKRELLYYKLSHLLRRFYLTFKSYFVGRGLSFKLDLSKDANVLKIFLYFLNVTFRERERGREGWREVSRRKRED